jgi:hypothetical protein
MECDHAGFTVVLSNPPSVVAWCKRCGAIHQTIGMPGAQTILRGWERPHPFFYARRCYRPPPLPQLGDLGDDEDAS